MKTQTKKLRPSGVSKTQTQKKSWKLRPEKYNKFTPRDEPTCLLFVDTVASLPRKEKQLIVLDTWNVHENYLPRKQKKKLAVWDTCNAHENYTQHSYRFFFSLSYPRVVSLEAIREVCCVMFSCTNTGPASRYSSGGYFKPDTTFRGPYSSLIWNNNGV